jgi:tRNA-2-methylthio-N6-dimethylallyladenosine synthase
VGPDHYRALPALIDGVIKRQSTCVVTGFDEGRPEDFLPSLRPAAGSPATAFLTIMKGCSHHCTYCIVPSVRGPERCREPDEIVREAEALVKGGAKELMLLGQKVNGYKKGGTSFAELLGRLNEVPGLERLRFTSPHPRHMTDDLIDAMGSLDKVCESIHLPVQSGSDRVLRAMRRHYTSDFYREVAQKLKATSPGFLISTDLIVGFPGETEQDFEETLRLYEDVRFSGAFSFKYSERPGTYAATQMTDDVPPEEKTRRLDALHCVIDRIEGETKTDLVGQHLEILVEGPARKPGQWTGRARNNQIVNFSPQNGAILEEWRGELAILEITRAFPHCLEGRLS